MFETINVLSRQNMIETAPYIAEPSAIISISDEGQDFPPLDVGNSNVLQVLYLSFDDMEDGPSSMSDDDAEQIVEFIQDADDNGAEHLYVHCGAGVSRSAGTAAAIMMLYWGDDADIFDDGRYAPNMHCYRMVLDAAGFGYDADEAAQKEARNFNLWKILHADDLD